ncbi:efflux RND transporter periplasmic adaptor subunit [Salidesulfovibrio onnuriiensis]|uniref:efflux RND transporter periplasmic adaptor subunit n=1 Tax=Salidesulfovibrio onnuriiensis TaxID=2583823 RepID=UPI0011C77252|nr:efflux RND transporter periplasmic adaptor subunit [Salidesulfovibrio onnuriiensis]
MKRLIFVLSCVVLLFAQGCGGEPEQVQAPIRPVKIVVVDERGAGMQWTFAGTAEDALETDLSFRVGGKIIEFPGDQIGRKFAKDEVIARLDPADYELELREAKANMEQIRANYVRAKADFERNAELYERKVISKSEMDQADADFKSYEAQLNASAKKLDIARKQLSYTTLNAPFDGWIGKVHTKVHQNVASGQAVASLNAGRQMKMYITVPDVLISQVSEGDAVEVRFDALPGMAMAGKVMEISPESSAGSGYPVKVYLDNADKLVRSGMSGQVCFMGRSERKSSYFLPPVAVVGESTGTRSVWVVDRKTSTVQRKDVSVGRLTEGGLEILNGVKAGDMVVIRGVHRLKDGLKVRFNSNGTEG